MTDAMTRRLRARLRLLGPSLNLLALVVALLLPAAASASPEMGSPEAIAEARAHFARGKELYQAGAYREAIVELDAARALDPRAKDLVYNLAIVHEKLGQIDDALRFARLYLEMDLEAAERTRAEGYIKRLEGAKTEVEARKVQPAKVERADEGPVRGRLDAATVGVGIVALGATAGGVAFGVKALGDKPSSFVTGRDGTLADLQHRVSTAHTEAVGADVCFAGAIGAAAATAVLYFARFRDAPDAARTGVLSIAPLTSARSGGLVLGGAF